MAVRHLPTNSPLSRRTAFKLSRVKLAKCLMSCSTLLTFFQRCLYAPAPNVRRYCTSPDHSPMFPNQQAPFCVLRSRQKLPVHIDPRTVPSLSFPSCRLLHMSAGVCAVVARGLAGGRPRHTRRVLPLWLARGSGSYRVVARACSSCSSGASSPSSC